jgi:hypothetical protein
VVGDQSFGELIDSPVLDYGTVRGVTNHSPLIAPWEVADGCTRLTEYCGVPLLRVDFKIERATGEWFFRGLPAQRFRNRGVPLHAPERRRSSWSGWVSTAVMAWSIRLIVVS